MTLLQKYTRLGKAPLQQEIQPRLYSQQSGYNQQYQTSYVEQQPYEVDPIQLLQSIPITSSDDVVLQQIQFEIQELNYQLEAIQNLKKLEKPLKKRQAILNSFLTKLQTAQKEILDTNVSVIPSPLSVEEYKGTENISDFIEHKVDLPTLPPPVGKVIPEQSFIDINDDDDKYEEFKLK